MVLQTFYSPAKLSQNLEMSTNTHKHSSGMNSFDVFPACIDETYICNNFPFIH